MFPRRESPHSLAPVAGLGLVLAVLVLALLPNTGAIPADSTCPYNSCPTGSGSPSSVTPWYILLAVLVVVAAALAVLIVLRRRRGVGGSAPPVEEWSGATPGGPEGPEGPALTDESPGDAAAITPPMAATAAYIEGPEDVGHAPPGTTSTPPAAGEGDDADIDSLMKELDKISGEILKKGKPKTPVPDPDETTD